MQCTLKLYFCIILCTRDHLFPCQPSKKWIRANIYLTCLGHSFFIYKVGQYSECVTKRINKFIYAKQYLTCGKRWHMVDDEDKAQSNFLMLLSKW